MNRTIFYRVVPDFMIQGGNSDDDKTAGTKNEGRVASYYIPSEVTKSTISTSAASVAMAMSYRK